MIVSVISSFLPFLIFFSNLHIIWVRNQCPQTSENRKNQDVLVYVPLSHLKILPLVTRMIHIKCFQSGGKKITQSLDPLIKTIRILKHNLYLEESPSSPEAHKE